MAYDKDRHQAKVAAKRTDPATASAIAGGAKGQGHFVDNEQRKDQNKKDLAALDIESSWTHFNHLTAEDKYRYIYQGGCLNYAEQKYLVDRFRQSFPRDGFDNLNQWINATTLNVS